MIKTQNSPVDMEKALKKWKGIVEKLGVTNPEKIASLCEYAQMHADSATAGLVKENVAYGNVANTAGMGNVVMPGLSGTPGLPGAAGSGDLGIALLPGAIKIAAQTIGLELLPTINVNTNRPDLLYFDFTYDDTAGLDNDERATTFKFIPAAAGDATALKAWLRAEMLLTNTTEMRGRLSKPLYFHLSGGALGGAVGAYDSTIKPVGSLQGWVQFVGFSRIDDMPMFRAYTQTNTASSGAWTFNVALNTFPATGALTTLLSAGQIDATTTSALELINAVTTVALVSLNEDFVDGFTTNYNYKPMTRGQWDASNAPKIGPNSFVKTVEIGVAHVSAAIRLSEVNDYKKMYGVDIVQRTQAQLLNQISQTISTEIVEKVKELGLRNRSTVAAVPYVLANWGPITDPKQFDISVPLVASTLGGEHNASIARFLMKKIETASYYIATDGRISSADFMVVSGTIAAQIKTMNGYSINANDIKLSIQGQLAPAGTFNGIKVYVDPYMNPNDTTIYLGRKGKAEEPGLKFLAYLLAESVEIISEATMGPRLYMYSRYAICEFGFFPEKQYLAVKTYDPNGILS